MVAKKLKNKKKVASGKPLATTCLNKDVYITDMEYDAYFGGHIGQWYMAVDEKYKKSSGLIWSWWAFCFPFLYLFVRRAYLVGIFAFLTFFILLNLVPAGFILAYFALFAVASAMLCPYFVLQKFKKVRQKIVSLTANKTEQLILLQCRGGRNYIILVLGIFLYFFLFASMMAVVSYNPI